MLNGETEVFDWENDDALEELRCQLLGAIDVYRKNAGRYSC